MYYNSIDILKQVLFNQNYVRLVVIELKLGEFEVAHSAHINLYLKWLHRYERQEYESEIYC